jgi:MinD-like ATPase involved in chromosome partitioning or flagellar assembly
MHVVTFYSYKGGTGRSMALVNVAALLAKRGKRVLVVDFDLEAPGLTTFASLRPTKPAKGLVDFVTAYLATNESPDCEEYVYAASGSDFFELNGQVWVMPAGLQDDSYGVRLNTINWLDLYERRDGFLLFEDLKQQWSKKVKPDYVLIDSRTGHTDIAGICTRQLPDAVALFYFPNEQNLIGLGKIVADIRAEERAGRRGPITKHFVVSNVPDLDDEDQILDARLKDFKKALGYESDPAIVHHYHSLALLDQAIFATQRPNSRLAREYDTVARLIMQANPEDREASLAFLQTLASSFPDMPANISSTDVRNRVDSILQRQGADGEIVYWVSRFKRIAGDQDESLALLDQALARGFQSPAAYYDKAQMLMGLRRPKDAAAVLQQMLSQPDGKFAVSDTLRAFRLAIRLSADSAREMTQSIAVRNLSPQDRVFLAYELDESVQGARLASYILADVVGELDQKSAAFGNALGQYRLTLIALGQLTAALALFPRDAKPADIADIADAFNIGMLRYWLGETDSKDWFERVLELHTSQGEQLMDNANYLQCISFAFWVIGDKPGAIDLLAKARRIASEIKTRIFSTWRYYRVFPSIFLRDLHRMQRLYEGKSQKPSFLSPSARAAH